MTVERIAEILTKWQAVMRECELRMDQLAALVGPVVDSPIGDSVYRVMGAYTKQVADVIEWCDETLESWWIDHNFGERPMGIGFPGEELRMISTVEELSSFIAEDLKRAA